jgi:putative aminopeptidase FrvX
MYRSDFNQVTKNHMTATESKISEDDIRWIKEYIKNAAPSGDEVSGQRMWLEYIKPFVDSHFADYYGNAAALINADETFKVVIEAHADEIAWYVHTIADNGFLHVEKNGGSDPGIAPSQKVRIHTQNGIVPGVFGWPAIHTRGTSSSNEPRQDTIFIDCGCSSKLEVEHLGIQVGDCITYESTLSVLNKKYFVGRGQDNKIGGFIIATVARLLHENKIRLPYGLYIVNSVQEEVGLHGAALMANSIKPNCAIITDVTHATHTPLVNKNKEGDIDLGMGPVIIKSPSVHNKLREHIINTAKAEKIPFQLAVSSKKTGTDTDSFAYSGSGIPSALISLPLRYMHTTVETTNKEDIENAIRLLYTVLTSLKPDFNFRYF